MISVVLATYNEEKNIARCLQSVKKFTDEIIVVDGTSTDNTVEIAKKLGARVIKTTNKPVFHINKQLAMNEAKGELVLQLDADEVVDDELANFIQQVHTKMMHHDEKKLPSAWWIKRKNWFLNKFLTKGGQYPDPVIRLYQNGKARLPQKDVHEQMDVDGDLGWADGHLLHYSSPTFTEYLRKWNDYTSLKATQLREAKVNISIKNTIVYLVFKPLMIFLSIFIRHKGFVDGYPGFVFALYSGLYFPVSYLKLWELLEKKNKELT
ncbi:MAG: glycosyltransferase family 2 protein [Patescibacteria group bacterium]